MFQLILSMIIWGTLGLAVLKSGLSSIEIAFFRCLIGAAILIPYCWYRGYFSNKHFTKKLILLVSISGIFVVLNWILLFQSFKLSSITLGNVSYYVQPIFLVMIGRVFFKEKISYLKWILISLTALGVVMTMNLSLQQLHLHTSELLGVMCALAAGLFYSFATAIVKNIKEFSSSAMLVLQMMIGSLMLLPFVSFSDIHFSLSVVFYLGLFGILYTVVAFLLYYQAVKKLPTTHIAVISYFDPIVAILTDILFFHRELNTIQILGIVITLVGSYFVVNERIFSRIFPYLPAVFRF